MSVSAMRLPPQVATIRPVNGWLDVDLRELWEYRELLYFLVWRDIKIRYKQTVIGAAWALLQPVFTMIVFTIFFGRLAQIPSGGLPYPVFYYAALLPWLYFAGALTNATNTLVDHQRVITRVYFPRLLLPVSAVMAGLVDLAVGCTVLFGLMGLFGMVPGWRMLSLPLFIALASFTAMAVGLWLSALNALYRDVRYAIPFVVQFWMFASPVAYPSSLVPARWQWLYGLNPIAGVIEGFRWAVSGDGAPSGPLLFASVIAVFIVFVAGLIFFRRMEAEVADSV
jgi:lipopolysaccharide transport system permease protein